MNLSDQKKKQFVWALDRAGLTQHEIANHQMVGVSQATVSRWLNDYDPAEDGFDLAAPKHGVDEEFTPEAKEKFRDAVFQLLTCSGGLSTTIPAGEDEDLEDFREMWISDE